MLNILKCKIIIVITLIFCSVANAQELPYSFEHYTIKNGLSSNTVFSTYRDSYGFLWVGTEDGLNRFDGYTFKVYRYNADVEAGLKSNHITALCEDAVGRVWIGTNGGSLSYYDRKLDKIVSYDKHVDGKWLSTAITTINTDIAGNIWVGSYGGLFIINVKDIGKPLDIRYTDIEKKFFKMTSRYIFRDSQGRMWIAAENRIYQFASNLKESKVYPAQDPLKADRQLMELTCIEEDEQKRIWVSSLQGLLYKGDHEDQFSLFQESGGAKLGSQRIYSIANDTKGGLWIGTDNGLGVLNTENFELKIFNKDPRNMRSISHKSVRSIYLDKFGIYWVGTVQGGLNKFDVNLNQFNLKTIDSYGKNEVSMITSFLPFKSQVVVGTDGGGLYRYDRSLDKLTAIPIGDQNLTVLALKNGDHPGDIWLGTFGKGVIKFNLETQSRAQYLTGPGENQLNNSEVFSLEKDIYGDIWVGTNGGGINVIRLKDGAVKKFRRSDNPKADEIAPSADFIRALRKDHDGNMWVGTYGAGIFVYNPYTRKTMYYNKNANALPNNYVLSIYTDRAGNVYAGTNGNGVGLLQKGDKQFKTLSEREGLINDVVQSIVEDNTGKMWFSTNKGLSCYDPLQKTFKNYAYSVGLQEGAFAIGAGLMLPDGEVYFGGQEGFNHFYPKNLKINTNPSKPVLTELKIDNKVIKPSKEGILSESLLTAERINLKYKQNFSISFAALNLTVSEDNQYQYRLKGFDKDWIKAHGDHAAYYTNLDPGEYTFEVKASNNDGIWDDEIKSIVVYVEPPIWLKGYAFVFYGILFLSGLYWLKSRGVRKLKQKFVLEQERRDADNLHQLDQMKIKFLTNLSHEFRTPISLITGPIEILLLKEKDKETSQQIALIKRNAHRLLNLVNQLLDFRKMEENELKLHNTKGDLVSFVKDMYDSFSDMAIQKEINYRFISCEDHVLTAFDHNKIERIIFNLLSNAFKFTAKGGHISVYIKSVEVQEEGDKIKVKIVIKDDGIGIPKESHEAIFDSFYQHDTQGNVLNQGSGIGLSIADSFVKMYGGKLCVESEPGFGSTFSFDLFLEKMDVAQEEVVQAVIGVEQDAADPHMRLRPVVLIIEDDDDFRGFLKSRLDPLYQTFEASNGQEGWQKALFHHPDLIISDVQMPIMNGMELTQKLVRDKRTKHIPIILLTASRVENGLVCGLESGAVDYISKPFDMAALLAKVNSLLLLNQAFKDTYSKQLSFVSPEVEVMSEKEKFLQSVFEYVYENLDNPQLSVELLSSHLSISRTSLYNRLLEFSGMSPVDFIRSVRLERAANLLEKNSNSISEIAYETGFSNPNYFTKVFKAKYKMTPSEYIQAQKNLVK
ncbi:hybrid sensor histidine kinase/response regulator transcription factor [Sphingobacterium anhuiense]|uniref:histidine kinase n=1 Tax=Sphingobacterium anhuiense TaxID=493780 RepID=A0ABW5YW13_9SPHI